MKDVIAKNLSVKKLCLYIYKDDFHIQQSSSSVHDDSEVAKWPDEPQKL